MKCHGGKPQGTSRRRALDDCRRCNTHLKSTSIKQNQTNQNQRKPQTNNNKKTHHQKTKHFFPCGVGTHSFFV